jgi:hypothetical protein
MSNGCKISKIQEDHEGGKMRSPCVSMDGIPHPACKRNTSVERVMSGQECDVCVVLKAYVLVDFSFYEINR